MKKIFYLFSIVCAIVLTNADVAAQTAYSEKEFEKKKSITQTYDLSGSDRVALNNKFGNIKINTWEDSKIKVEIEIVVNAKTEARATKIIDGITVNHSKESGVVVFKTKMDDNNVDGDKMDKGFDDSDKAMSDKTKSKNGGWGNLGIKINYNVFLPSSTSLKLHNEFGNTALSNYAGTLDVHNKFGNLVAENLSGSENEIHVEFGNAEIQSLSQPDLTVKFGNCELVSVVGKGILNFEFSGDVNIGLDKNAGDLKIKNSYSEIEFTLNENTNANFIIKSSYGEVRSKNKGLAIKSDDDDNDENKGCCDFTKEYNVSMGTGTSKINISNNYGKIKFR
jgi:Putative adhesin